jgi:Tol biopolymer transport system component
VQRPLLSVAASIFALALAGSAWAAFPGANGRIAFSRSVGPRLDYDLWTMRADGTGKRAVVGSRFADLEPSYSANGRTLVFVRDVDNRRARANDEIFTKNLVTGRVVRRTRNPAIDWNPAFSPDGSQIAFSSDRGPGSEYDIFLLDLATGDVSRISRPGDDFSPTFAADGSFVLWSGYRPNGRADLFRVALPVGVGENVTKTRWLSEEEPNVSPALTHVVYQRWRRGDTEIVLRPLSGGAARVLTRNRVSDLRPVFSPTGNRIAWEHSWDGTDTSGQIWTMRVDGTHKRARTPRRFDADSPDWQPRPS